MGACAVAGTALRSMPDAHAAASGLIAGWAAGCCVDVRVPSAVAGDVRFRSTVAFQLPLTSELSAMAPC